MKLRNIFEKQGGVKLLKQYWEGGALFTGIAEFLLLGNSRTSLEILRLATALKTKQKLEKKYGKILDELEKSFREKQAVPKEKYIWVCWMQGIENAPEIVKTCIQSIKDNITNRKVVLITSENYRKYVTFPDFIQLKINNKIIKGAHLTDLLRLELLDRYGGTWIDATVYCSGKNIPCYMLDSDLFLFQCLKPGRDGHITTISNWFITAKAHHKFIYLEKELLYSYWKENDTLVDYFIFHDFFQMIIEQYPEVWDEVIPFSNSTPHILLLRLFDEYDEIVWNAVKDQSPFHKLTYKFSKDDENKNNTYYSVVIRGEV